MKLFISGKRENAERVTEATAHNTSHEHNGTTIKRDVNHCLFQMYPFCGLIFSFTYNEKQIARFNAGLEFMSFAF